MSREVIDDLVEILLAHKGKVLGLLIGLIIAIMILTFGFLEAIFILFCMGVGYYFGRRLDEKKKFPNILDRMLPPND